MLSLLDKTKGDHCFWAHKRTCLSIHWWFCDDVGRLLVC